MEMFWVLLAIGGVVGVVMAVSQAKAMAAAKAAYEAALAALSAEPHSNDRRIAALNAGRHYAELARKKAGSKGVALFDEVAMQNDLTARLGAGATSPAKTASGGDDRVAKLTKLAELRDKGVLSPEEFDAEKKKLLAS